MSEAIDTYEERTDLMAQSLVAAWNKMSNYVGDRPFEQEKLPERQQVRQYQLVRNQPEAWAALAKEHGWKNTTEYMTRLERLCAKYPDEVLFGQEAIPPPQPPVAPTTTAPAAAPGGTPIPAEIPGQPVPVQMQ